jgi:microsomal dipeptidase-like Zn-dependent dipeptidase
MGRGNSDMLLVPAHINHIRAVAGVNHVGLGAGYDGINL